MSGGIEAVPGIVRAREMGITVVVSDGSGDAPGFAVADDRIIASTYDVEATVSAAARFHQGRPIDGVLSIASDIPLTVASVAAALGLPGISLESARLATDKLEMKRRFAADGVPVPAFFPVVTAEHLKELANEHGLPLVIKPVDSRGARGVLLLTPGVDLEWAFARSHEQSPTGRVLIERYISGAQISTESIVVDGKAHTLGFADRNYRDLDRFAPFMIENGGELPSSLPIERQAEVCALVQRATDSLGVRDGVVKGDIVYGSAEPYVIELAPRLSGGYLCTHEIPLNTGVDFVGAAIRIALGERPTADDLIPKYTQGVAQRWLFPAPGRITEISGVGSVAARPEVALCEVRVGIGDVLRPVESHPDRAGVIIATGATRAQAIANAERAVADIDIVTTRS